MLLFLTILLSVLSLSNTMETVSIGRAGGHNPLSPKASALRYWAQRVSDNRPRPTFIVSKLSPLSASQSAVLNKLADEGALSTRLSEFCTWAGLFCAPAGEKLATNRAGEKLVTNRAGGRDDAGFAVYDKNRNFTDYGGGASSSRPGGVDSFKNYSDGLNIAVESFKRYNRDAARRSERFANYAPDGNVATGEFSSYGVSANGGAGEFANYNHLVNNPNLHFSTYNSDGVGRPATFGSYSDEANSGPGQSFTSYGKRGTGTPTTFTSYGLDSNVIGSSFSAYGEDGNDSNDTFTSYGADGNVPKNTFNSYGDGGNAAVESFSSYRDAANVGDDTFMAYGKSSNSGKASFTNYGNSFNGGTDTFKGYGKGGAGHVAGFKSYTGNNSTFKDYANNKTTSFALYKTASSQVPLHAHHMSKGQRRKVEDGKFFREFELNQGNSMKMPDISNKMPPRSFLPLRLAKKLPFSTGKVGELLRVFGSDPLISNSTMATIIRQTLEECERLPSRGETKRCVASAEDMVDFAVEMLGKAATPMSTTGLGGSGMGVEVGLVEQVQDGRITKSVSCHQSLFPYLVYYCHSVPYVRVYEVDLLHYQSKAKINRGVAICHLDTSAWAPGHGAFVVLGGGPGKIEVCHWIYEDDMTWVIP